MDLTTSFPGEDSLDISLDAGYGGHLSELDLNATRGDALIVDGISYTFPLGDKTTVFFGDNMDAVSYKVLHVLMVAQQMLWMTAKITPQL